MTEAEREIYWRETWNDWLRAHLGFRLGVDVERLVPEFVRLYDDCPYDVAWLVKEARPR